MTDNTNTFSIPMNEYLAMYRVCVEAALYADGSNPSSHAKADLGIAIEALNAERAKRVYAGSII